MSNAFGGSWNGNTYCNAGNVNKEFVGYTGAILQGAGPANLYGPCSSYSSGTGFYKYRCVFE